MEEEVKHVEDVWTARFGGIIFKFSTLQRFIHIVPLEIYTPNQFLKMKP